MKKKYYGYLHKRWAIVKDKSGWKMVSPDGKVCFAKTLSKSRDLINGNTDQSYKG